LQQRRATALDYRLQGHPFWKIGKALNCHPSTAQSYVIRAMKDMLPVEKREAVLQMELQRLDTMQAAVYRNAEDGDIPSQEAVLRIACGLHHVEPLHFRLQNLFALVCCHGSAPIRSRAKSSTLSTRRRCSSSPVLSS
jgi:hypothetical protein